MAPHHTSLDSLFCEEENDSWEDESSTHPPPFPPHTDPLSDHLLFLLRKEKHNPQALPPPVNPARGKSLQWLLNTSALLNLSTVTTVAAISYLDRFLLTFSWDGKPWTMQLAAVACLSIASKMEEVTLHRMMEFQVGECAFEAKTVQRMELLVLSSLNWEMNHPTPLSFLRHLLPAHRSRLFKCESILLSAIFECSICAYRPSLWAAALIIHVVHECDSSGYQGQLMAALGVTEEEVKECRSVMAGGDGGSSPRGVTDASFSCNSWEEEERCEPKLKRRRMGEGEGDELQHNSITCHCF